MFVALVGPFVPRPRNSPTAADLLDGVNVAALALMAAVTLQLALVALTGTFTVLLAAGALFLLARFGVDSAWLVLGGPANRPRGRLPLV